MYNASRIERRRCRRHISRPLSEPEEGHARRATAVGSRSLAADEAAYSNYPSNGDERLNPLRCGFPVCDGVGGLNAAFAIMAALYHRERTGEGQFIDVALLDSIMPLMGWVAANLLIGNQ